eukprot:130190-Chlamydomonas_euryale.AAC.2
MRCASLRELNARCAATVHKKARNAPTCLSLQATSGRLLQNAGQCSPPELVPRMACTVHAHGPASDSLFPRREGMVDDRGRGRDAQRAVLRQP